MIESQFANVEPKPKKRGRPKLRKNYDVIALAPRKAKGRYRKGQGLNRGLRVQRKPIMGDTIIHSEAAIWLRR